MSDETMRTMERNARAGDPKAARALVDERRRTGGFQGALDAWLSLLAGAFDVEFAGVLGGYNYKPLRVEPGKKYVRVMAGDGAYCFIDRENGNILKCATWRAPEPKKIPRGNIYGDDPLNGCGPHGVAYVGETRNPWKPEARNAPPLIIFSLDAKAPEKAPEPKTFPEGTLLRVRQTFGACNVVGEAIADKGKHFTYKDAATGKTKTAKKIVQPPAARMARETPHTEPCESCADHPDTRFKPGNCSIHGNPQPCTTCMST